MIATALAGACRLISGASVYWQCDPYASAQRIYFGNHASHLDFIVIWSALPPRLRRPTRPVAGRDYWNQGTVRRYLAGKVFRAVLIERGEAGSRHAPAAARVSVQRIAEAMGDIRDPSTLKPLVDSPTASQGLPDLAHAACPEQAGHVVVPEASSGGQGHGQGSLADCRE